MPSQIEKSQRRCPAKATTASRDSIKTSFRFIQPSSMTSTGPLPLVITAPLPRDDRPVPEVPHMPRDRRRFTIQGTVMHDGLGPRRNFGEAVDGLKLIALYDIRVSHSLQEAKYNTCSGGTKQQRSEER
ncbi:hypothetical protein E4U19_007141 [Claviceps sp. Clav32 group G5]|nr:hypothetical protein E4U19_007141 [Claviceps sp. Clav32 group G5]KAG6042706.1 hypothetical protein E4U39_005551 [Claviceps sp. Clav50 group G5]